MQIDLYSNVSNKLLLFELHRNLLKMITVNPFKFYQIQSTFFTNFYYE